MDIYTEPGEKVLYTGKNGYDSDKEYANKYLKVGQQYTVSNINIYDWYSKVEFEELKGLTFNTVHFENV